MGNLMEVKKGLMTYLKASSNAFTTSIGGRLYFDIAPNDPVFPYCVAYLISNIPDRDSDNRFENPQIQFSIYQKRDNTERVGFIADKLKARLDDIDSTLSVTGYTSISVDRLNDLSAPVTMESLEGHILDYRIILQES